MPTSSASDPSTGRGSLWTGTALAHRHRREVDVPALRVDVALHLARDGVGPHIVDHPDEYRLVDHASVDPGQHLVEFLWIRSGACLFGKRIELGLLDIAPVGTLGWHLLAVDEAHESV